MNKTSILKTRVPALGLNRGLSQAHRKPYKASSAFSPHSGGHQGTESSEGVLGSQALLPAQLEPTVPSIFGFDSFFEMMPSELAWICQQHVPAREEFVSGTSLVMVSESSHSRLALGITDWVPAYSLVLLGSMQKHKDWVCGHPVPGSLTHLCGERFKQAWHRTSLGLLWQEELQHRRARGLQRSRASQSTCLVWHISTLQALEPLGS